MQAFKQAPFKIVLLGAGGTGGALIPHLYRIAYAAGKSIRVIVCDGDVIEEKNLLRQNFVRQDIGKNKARVLAERYAGAFGLDAEYVLSLPNNDDLFSTSHNKRRLDHRALLDTLAKKRPNYYYRHVLVPVPRETLKDFCTLGGKIV